MSYVTFFSMSDEQRRRTWRLFCWGGLTALICGGVLIAATSLWAKPLALESSWPWKPADWYSLGCAVVFALIPIGLAVFLWAVANYRVDRMVRRQQSGIARLDGLIRLWCALFFIGGVVVLGRMIFVGLSAAFSGWPTGEVRTLFLKDDHILDVAFAPPESTVLATTDKGELVAWDALRGKRIDVPAGTTPNLATARVRRLLDHGPMQLRSRDGQIVLEVSTDYETSREVVVRDGQGKELRRLVGHEGTVNALSLTADGKRALTGSSDKTVRFWDVETARELQKLTGHTASVSCVLFGPDGTAAYSGDEQGRIRAWDLKAGSERSGFAREQRHDKVSFLSISADGRRLLSTGQGGGSDKLCFWDTGSGTLLDEFSEHSIADGQTALSPDGRWGVTTGLSMIQLWRLER